MDSDGMPWVWGSNDKGELGLGDYTTRTAPFPLVGLQEKGITSIVVGNQFSIGFSKPKENVRDQGISMIQKSSSKEQISCIGIKITKKKSAESTSEGGGSVNKSLSVHSSVQRIDVYGMSDVLENTSISRH